MGYYFYMHNMPHTEDAKAKMRCAVRPKKYGRLPEEEIVNRLLYSDATTRSIANEYGCSDSTIKIVLRKHTTKEQRLEAKHRKQKACIRGRQNPLFGNWRRTHDVWTGRKHIPESRQKQSDAKTGRRLSLQVRIAQSARMQGILIEDWTGFVSTKMQRIRQSIEWREWRNAVFKRDDYVCQSCGERGGDLHPHHVLPKSQRPDLVFDVDNGKTLCALCHRKTLTYGVNNRKKSHGCGW